MNRRAIHVERGKRLEYLTIAYNSLEGIAAVALGLTTGSISLVGFGVDSGIEVTSAALLLWRLGMDSGEHREHVERVAIRAVGVCFLALAVYVAVESGRTLYFRTTPERSSVGIILAILSLIVMPWLTRQKRKVAAEIGSRALEADATQTQFCTYLSAILLCGLVLNVVFGWWWADPVAALVMVPIIANEGIEGVRGKSCVEEGCHS